MHLCKQNKTGDKTVQAEQNDCFILSKSLSENLTTKRTIYDPPFIFEDQSVITYYVTYCLLYNIIEYSNKHRNHRRKAYAEYI